MKKRNQSSVIVLILILLIIAIVPFFINQTQDFANYNNQCDYESKNYIGKSMEECSRIQFLCAPGFEQFDNKCGCGCEKSGAVEQEENLCTPESRKAEACIDLYQPVCGWFNPEKIQCIKYPCAQTFSNICYACTDEKVLYWTEGECPI